MQQKRHAFHWIAWIFANHYQWQPINNIFIVMMTHIFHYQTSKVHNVNLTPSIKYTWIYIKCKFGQKFRLCTKKCWNFVISKKYIFLISPFSHKVCLNSSEVINTVAQQITRVTDYATAFDVTFITITIAALHHNH